MIAEAIQQFADIKARSIVEARKHQVRETPGTWKDWIAENFAGYLWPPYASYHEEFWNWAWAIKPDESAPPFVAIWPRGFAKSTSVELSCALMAAERKRRYGLYVCAVQDKADDHVSNVGSLLESKTFSEHYPLASQRRMGKYGSPRGWRRNRLRTASGFTLDAIGLDTASRGAKVDEDRPDFIIFDDIDGLFDAPATIAKKIEMITQTILPARSQHAIVLVAQNLIHENGVVSQLADGRAAFLSDRIVSGPHPAIHDMVVETIDGKTTITGGDPTWPAVGIPELQAELNDIGITAFNREKQQEVGNVEGGIFGHLTFQHCKWSEMPELERVVVWVDPAVTDKARSDAHGIQADGIANGIIYRLYSWEQRTSPDDVMRRAILKAVELNAESVGVETDQGGDTWKTVFESSWDKLINDSNEPQITAETIKPSFREEKAGSVGPKAYRATQMLAAYERGEIVHVIGTHTALEKGLRRYLLVKPFDLVDAAYWAWNDLARGLTGRLFY